MKTTLASLILLAVVSLNTIAQDTSQWGLPEGAKARLGRGRIYDLKYSPDGTRLAAPSSTGIWLYDSATGDPVSLMRIGKVFAASSVAFSPDSRTLASFSGVLRLWDMATGELKHTMRTDFGSSGHVAFSSDGRKFATSSGTGVYVWDAQTGKKRHSLFAQDWERFGNVSSLAFSPDGRTLASGHRSPKAGHSSGTGKIGLWDVVTGERKVTLDASVPTVLAFSPDGGTLAVANVAWSYAFGSWGWVTLRDAATGEIKHELRGHPGGVYSLAYSADGRTIASGGHFDEINGQWSPTVCLWDAATGARLRSLEAYKWEVDSLALSPDGGTLAVASEDGRFTFWDTATGTQKRQVEGHSGPISSVAFSPDGGTVATGNRGSHWGWRWAGVVRLWNATTGAQIITLEGHREGITSVAFSPDGRTLASGSWDETVRLWDAATGENIRTLETDTEEVNSVAFSPDGNMLASAGGTSRRTVVRLWDAATGAHNQTLDGYNNEIVSMLFSPDGNRLASQFSGEIHLWDAEIWTLKRILTVSSGNKSLYSIAFSPDGGALAAGGWSAIHLWDTATGVQMPSLNVDGGGATIVTYSPDGYMFASGSIDNTVRLWDAATRVHLRTLDGHVGDIYSVAFSPDGRTLASGSSDGTVLLWEIMPSPVPLEDKPPPIKPDVNGDGGVDVKDLVLVAARLGITAEIHADVNGDGTVNILDLVLVAGMANDSTDALPMFSNGAMMLRTTQVGEWLEEARRLDFADAAIPRGIEYLEKLLEALTPERTKLLPNYPNPFNPETWIPYQLARDSVVRISIYSSKGILVRHLDLGLQPEGYYTDKHYAAYWDGRNEGGELLASGLYVYVFRAGSYRASRRMAIVR